MKISWALVTMMTAIDEVLGRFLINFEHFTGGNFNETYLEIIGNWGDTHFLFYQKFDGISRQESKSFNIHRKLSRIFKNLRLLSNMTVSSQQDQSGWILLKLWCNHRNFHSFSLFSLSQHKKCQNQKLSFHIQVPHKHSLLTFRLYFM